MVAVARLTPRVEKALAWAQRRLRTAFCLFVRPMTKAEQEDCPGAVMVIARTAREDADPLHFAIGYSPSAVASTSARCLRVLAVHEVLHGIVWNLSQLAEEGKKGAELKRAADTCESIVYQLQRLLVGEL